uniref:Uncharacterized protein n=1 Tax=Stomoxys calcitrans TaxID=35570 RepID=A0A1I8QEN6_STOCA
MLKHPELLFETNQEGVEYVKTNNRYAFLMESTSIEYNTMRECNLAKVGSTLDEKGYGIAMRKNWAYRDNFNHALLELQEQGELEKLKRKWWNEMGANLCSTKKEQADAQPLKLENLGGIYIVLIVGSVMAMIHGIISWMGFVYRKAKSHKVGLKVAFKEELKFVLEFTTYNRDLKSANSVYSPSRNSSCTIESMEGDNDMEKNKKEQADAQPLKLENLGGIYIVLIVGSVMAMIHGIISWMGFVYRKAKSHKVGLKVAFKEELKFVLEFTTYNRDLKSANSVYSPSRNSSCTIESMEGDNDMEKN